jgi:hypothetical protein
MGKIIKLRNKDSLEREQTIEQLEQLVQDLKDNKITSVAFGCVNKEDNVICGSWTNNWLALQGLSAVLMDSIRKYYNV